MRKMYLNTPDNTFQPRAQLSYLKYFVFFLNPFREVTRYYITIRLQPLPHTHIFKREFTIV